MSFLTGAIGANAKSRRLISSEPIRKHREPLNRVGNILIVFGFRLNAIDNCLNQSISVFDSHRHAHSQQTFPTEWKADQFENVLLGGDDQIRVAGCPVDSLPISRRVVMMIFEFEHVNDLPLPVMNDPVEGLRVRNGRHGNDLAARQETQRILFPTSRLKPDQSHWLKGTMENHSLFSLAN